VSDDHSSLDELADLDEGLLQPSRADEVRAHLAGCAACRDRHQSLRDVHDELAVLPPETMPPGVVEKLDRALADAAVPRSATIVPLAPAAQRRSGQRGWPAMAGVAAAIVVIGFVAAIAVGALGHGGSSDGGASKTSAGASGAGSNAPLSTSHFTKSVSSKTFNHTSVVAEVKRMVSGHPAGAASHLSPSTTRVPALLPQKLQPLFGSPPALLHCAASLTDRKDAVPLAVEFARYTTASVRAAPSVFFVFPVDPTHVDLYVAGPSCAGVEQVRDFIRVPVG
jgi:anti-sigma factor RsiW